jgi:ABC-type nitrate/sulfonate/bicarbonate transport system substrate-binding protein
LKGSRRAGLGTEATVLLIVAVLLVGGAASYYFIINSPLGTQPTQVTFAVSKTAGFAPLYVGLQKGLFLSQGINASFVTLDTDPALISAVSGGQAEFSVAAPLAVSDAISSGTKIQIIGNVETTIPPGAGIVVTANSPITSPSQLAGKKVGISAKGTLPDYLALMLEKKLGITFTEVTLTGSARTSALLGGQVDALVSVDPELYQLVASHQAKMLVDLSSELSDQWTPYSVLFTTTSMVQSHPDVVKKVMQGLYDSMAYMQNDPKDTVPLMANLTTSSPDVGSRLYNDTVEVLSSNGAIDPNALVQNINNLKMIAGDKTVTPPTGTLYDSAFVPVTVTATAAALVRPPV